MITGLLYGFIYLALLVFLTGCVIRAFEYARLPIHLRWELYPVPHEEASRVEHGGSYFEQLDWWKKPRSFNLSDEIGFMVPEMIFLKGLWEFNRKLWSRSFPFHFGLYLSIASATLLGADALVSLAWPVWTNGLVETGILYVCEATGILGSLLVIAGSLGLLAQRLSDEDMRTYTVPGDILNLVFFAVSFTLLLSGYAFSGRQFSGMLAFARGMLTLDRSVRVPGLLAAGMACVALLAAYVPYTHMSHFIAKYFTYHSVRWDDRVNVRGGELERKVAEYLTYRPTWSARHIAGQGVKTWAEVAAANPALEKKK